jgi:E3 ubiquitin-protein ligase HECTD2
LFKDFNAMKNYDGDDFEDIYCLDFSTTEEIGNELKTFNLIESGDQIEVKKENCEQFIQEKINFRYIKLVSDEMQAIRSSFKKFLVKENFFHFFFAEDLKNLTIGKKICFDSIKNNTEYEFCNENTPVITWLWEILSSFPQEKLEKFLS